MIFLKEPFVFEWDKGNKDKNLIKHSISTEEIEEVFFDDNKVLLEDMMHSNNEERYILLGKSVSEKILFVAFTIRREKIRVISARKLNKRELHLYEK